MRYTSRIVYINIDILDKFFMLLGSCRVILEVINNDVAVASVLRYLLFLPCTEQVLHLSKSDMIARRIGYNIPVRLTVF